jgi:hypothetical protein
MAMGDLPLAVELPTDDAEREMYRYSLFAWVIARFPYGFASGVILYPTNGGDVIARSALYVIE